MQTLEKTIGEKRNQGASHGVAFDADLAIKALQGLADVNAGRSSPVSDVRARVLARYEQQRVCV